MTARDCGVLAAAITLLIAIECTVIAGIAWCVTTLTSWPVYATVPVAALVVGLGTVAGIGLASEPVAEVSELEGYPHMRPVTRHTTPELEERNHS